MMKKMIFLSIISIFFAATQGMEYEGKPSETFMRRTRKYFGDMTQCASFCIFPDENLTPLGKAADENNLKCAKILIKIGAEVDGFRKEHLFLIRSVTPLYKASENGNVDMAKFLLKKGADISKVSSRRSVLHSIVYGKSNSTECKQLVDLFSQHDDGMKVFIQKNLILNNMISVNRPVQCMLWMLNLGANPNIKDILGNGPLHNLSSFNAEKLDAINMFIQAGSDVNDTNKKGETAIHKAVLSSKLKTVQALIEGGADPHAKDSSGRKSIDMLEVDPNNYFICEFLGLKSASGHRIIDPRNLKKDSKIRSILQEAMRKQEESQ